MEDTIYPPLKEGRGRTSNNSFRIREVSVHCRLNLKQIFKFAKLSTQSLKLGNKKQEMKQNWEVENRHYRDLITFAVIMKFDFQRLS